MKGASEDEGASVTRSTRTWSPTRSVLAIDEDGMTKFWKRNVITKRPTAKVEQSEANSRNVVSVFLAAGV
jgi:hypothetical protein